MYVFIYRGSPTYGVFTTADPTTAVFGLSTRKWGIFALVGDQRPTVPLTQILHNVVFFMTQNPRKVGIICITKNVLNFLWFVDDFEDGML